MVGVSVACEAGMELRLARPVSVAELLATRAPESPD
jgi:hypothetical protein